MKVYEINGVAAMVAGDSDWWQIKAHPALATMTAAERVEIVAAVSKVQKAINCGCDEASWTVDEMCALPDGTALSLCLWEHGPMHD
jgi:hypothetical protein